MAQAGTPQQASGIMISSLYEKRRCRNIWRKKLLWKPAPGPEDGVCSFLLALCVMTFCWVGLDG